MLRAQIKAIFRNISELCASSGPTVESSVTNRLNVHCGGTASLADLKGASDDMRQLVLDVSQSLTHSHTSDMGVLVKRICCDALTTAYEKLSESVSSKVRTSHDMLRSEIKETETSLRQLFGVGCETSFPIAHTMTSSLCSSSPVSPGGDANVDAASFCHKRCNSHPEQSIASFCVGDYVTPQGLSACHLNGRSGEITCFAISSGPFGVRLYGEKNNEQALLPKNLAVYASGNNELCVKCGDILNLNAFPPCDCRPRDNLPNMADPAGSKSTESAARY